MVTAIVIVLFLAIFVFGFYRGRKDRKKAENFYYIAVLSLCFTIIILKNLDILTFDPAKELIELFNKIGLSE